MIMRGEAEREPGGRGHSCGRNDHQADPPVSARFTHIVQTKRDCHLESSRAAPAPSPEPDSGHEQPAFTSGDVARGHPGLVCFGGAVGSITQATIGPVTLRVAGGTELDLSCDLALIGVGAVSADAGYSTSNVGEAAMMREMMSRAARVAIMADSTKFGRKLFAQVSELGSADYLITDMNPSADLVEALSENDVELLTPETSSSSS